jgi:hypothetical protein
MSDRFLRPGLGYLGRGWPVVPVSGKLPLVAWKRYQTEIPTPDELAGWPWCRAIGLAVVIGPDFWRAHPYRWCLEIEARHRAEAEPWLDAEFGHWRTAGLVCESGGGGLHVYCEAAAAVRSTVYPWGEIRGAGNISVLPPSGHPSGRRYRWLVAVEPLLLGPDAVPGVTIRDHVQRDREDDRDEGERPDARRIFSGCAYLRHVRDDAATLREPEWHAGLSVLALCRDGEALAHEISSPYPGYTREETQAKYERARAEDKPMTCETIGHDRGGEDWCRHCPLPRWVKSPIELGHARPTLVIGGNAARPARPGSTRPPGATRRPTTGTVSVA